VFIDLSDLSALLSVIIIDIVLAGDNAIVVGMAAAGLPAQDRRRVNVYGILAAPVQRLHLARDTVHLLAIIGLTLAGGVLLLWVSWKMYRDLREAHVISDPAEDESSVELVEPAAQGRKTMGQAMLQIVIADVSMSLDNVLAVAGVAHQSEPWILVVGLVLSVALMGTAATYIARLLERYPWISWVGLGIITFVALRMIWDGSHEILHSSAMFGFGS
jgi:YjbE family integral membrane protein